MTNTLSNRQLTEYEHQGIVFPIKALSSEEAAYFNSEFKALIKRCGLRRRLDNLHLFFEWAYRLVTHDAVLDVRPRLAGEKISWSMAAWSFTSRRETPVMFPGIRTVFIQACI